MLGVLGDAPFVLGDGLVYDPYIQPMSSFISNRLERLFAGTGIPAGQPEEMRPERTGREAAKKRGVRLGRPAKLTTEQIALGQRLIAEGKSAREVAKMFKVHAATLYRALSDPATAETA